MVGIKNTAVCFGELFCKTYEVSIAAKGNIRTDFSIDFLKKDFFHAVGLQYLKDIDLDKNPEEVYDKIMTDVTNDDLLEKSSFYLEVEDNYMNVKERIEQVAYLEECLDSKNLIFKYIGGKNPYSIIKAEFLIEASLHGKTFMIFLTKRKESENYRIVSFFEKKASIKRKNDFGYIRLNITMRLEKLRYFMLPKVDYVLITSLFVCTNLIERGNIWYNKEMELGAVKASETARVGIAVVLTGIAAQR